MSIVKIDTMRHFKIDLPEGETKALALFSDLLLCATDKGVFAYTEKGWTKIKPGDPNKAPKQEKKPAKKEVDKTEPAKAES